MTTYDVLASRDEGYWALEIPELDLITQARRLDEAEAMARSIISLDQEIAGDTFDVAIRVELPHEIRAEIDRARALRAEADDAIREAARLSRDAARRLHDAGVPLRDVGEVLGVSYQRAHQLVSA